ncbi:capsular biosynthesis protein [Neobacillus notoginsengisoli]|uniref:Capsular biosynthesis protein n=1 Tax=Neobacillus notoginsengisoli TaxID=1578198 RepID=A0A417YGW5_9BACI|nr:Wzz/FepE/Etk N-terminal domain-containing protein [Neobacillus notoginsengisoli]RHW32121.1 capsular biosynthesis protein [Neobacillus notoginsengisoli]
MEETISLKELFETLKKRLKLIIAITAVAVLASAIISFFVLTPVYQASTQLLVNQAKKDQPMISTNEVQTNLQLINTYNVIIKSPAILDIVKRNLNYEGDLNPKINVGSERDSQVLNISVQDTDPKMAVTIANETAEVFETEIKSIMHVDNVKILAKAELAENPSPIKPRPLLNIAIALVVGLMAGVGVAFLLEYLDNTVKTEQDIDRILGLPVLGVIATIDSDQLVEMKAKRTERNERRKRTRGETFGS